MDICNKYKYSNTYLFIVCIVRLVCFKINKKIWGLHDRPSRFQCRRNPWRRWKSIIFLNMKETNMELMGKTFQEYGKT